MKAGLLALAVFCSLPGLGSAQYASCPGCVLGIYDTAELGANYGTFDGIQKKLHLGIRFDPDAPYDGLTGIELSIQGLPRTTVPPAFTILNGGIKVGDSFITPPDTTDPAVQSGCNVVWSRCQVGSRALLEIVLVSVAPIPNDTVIRVLRRFPPLNPEVSSVLFTQCNLPSATITTPTGGCYVINPTVGPGESVGDPPCRLVRALPVAARASTWSAVKDLFR